MTNPKYSTLFCLLFSAITAFAQKEAPVYFKYNHVIKNADSADYYRVIDSRDGDNYRFTEFHKDGTWVKALATGNINDPYYIGDQTFYYKNGRIAVANQFSKGRCIKTTGYYPNGVLLQVIEYRTTWPQQLIAYDADSSGRVHIINGNGERQETDSIAIPAFNIHLHYTMTGPYKDGLKNGLWKGTDDRGFSFEEKYEAGKLVSGTTKTPEGKKYHYTRLYQYPKFKGDIDKFEVHILPALKNKADTTGLKFFKPGFLNLSYIINEDGSVSNLTGYKK
ncbi:MAG: hypothetical protein ACXVJE_08960, partial [Mucilaginibacter sp.]